MGCASELTAFFLVSQLDTDLPLSFNRNAALPRKPQPPQGLHTRPHTTTKVPHATAYTALFGEGTRDEKGNPYRGATRKSPQGRKDASKQTPNTEHLPPKSRADPSPRLCCLHNITNDPCSDRPAWNDGYPFSPQPAPIPSHPIPDRMSAKASILRMEKLNLLFGSTNDLWILREKKGVHRDKKRTRPRHQRKTYRSLQKRYRIRRQHHLR